MREKSEKKTTERSGFGTAVIHPETGEEREKKIGNGNGRLQSIKFGFGEFKGGIGEEEGTLKKKEEWREGKDSKGGS